MICPLPASGAVRAMGEALVAHARLHYTLRSLGIVPEEWPQACWPHIVQIITTGILRPAGLLGWCRTAADVAPAEPMTEAQLLEVLARLAAMSYYVSRLTSPPFTHRKVHPMATPRLRYDDPLDPDASAALSESNVEVLPRAIPAPPTIQDVMDTMAIYLLAQYPDSLTDQEAVHDAARMLADGHVIPAWRHLARMIEGVLNVPPGG